MDSHIREFYTAYSQDPDNGHFHTVIPLHENNHLPWNVVQSYVPKMCKGWFELAHLTPEDRIEFTREYWLNQLPYEPDLLPGLLRFFSSLDDIGIFLIQPRFDDPFVVHFVYSLRNNGGFFHGELPASDEEIRALQEAFSSILLPIDFLAFLQIHNGFSKLTDTGVFPARSLPEKYREVQGMIDRADMVVTASGEPVDPTALIPFYQSFGRPLYQCFFGQWYPAQEMGNVYFSGVTCTISDYFRGGAYDESLAFPTFLDWLVFYLEKIEL